MPAPAAHRGRRCTAPPRRCSRAPPATTPSTPRRYLSSPGRGHGQAAARSAASRLATSAAVRSRRVAARCRPARRGRRAPTAGGSSRPGLSDAEGDRDVGADGAARRPRRCPGRRRWAGRRRRRRRPARPGPAGAGRWRRPGRAGRRCRGCRRPRRRPRPSSVAPASAVRARCTRPPAAPQGGQPRRVRAAPTSSTASTRAPRARQPGAGAQRVAAVVAGRRPAARRGRRTPRPGTTRARRRRRRPARRRPAASASPAGQPGHRGAPRRGGRRRRLTADHGPHPGAQADSATTTALAMPASWDSDRCRWRRPARRPRAATVPRDLQAAGGRSACDDHRGVEPVQAGRGAERLGQRLLGREPGGQRGQRQPPLGLGEQPVQPAAACARGSAPNRATSTTSMPTPTITARARYSTVTDLARLRGWSTSRPLAVASSQANTCSGTVVTSGASSVGVRGTRMMVSAYGHDVVVALLGDHDGARAAGPDLLDVGDDLAVQRVAPARRGDDDEDRQALLDQRDRAVLELAGREALGVDVGELLELQRALERHREADVPAEEQHRPSRRPSRGRAARTGSMPSSTCWIWSGTSRELAQQLARPRPRTCCRAAGPGTGPSR